MEVVGGRLDLLIGLEGKLVDRARGVLDNAIDLEGAAQAIIFSRLASDASYSLLTSRTFAPAGVFSWVYPYARVEPPVPGEIALSNVRESSSRELRRNMSMIC